MTISKNLTTMMYAVDEENFVRPGYVLSQDADTTHFNTLYGYQINVQTSRVFATMEEAEAERDGTNASEASSTQAHEATIMATESSSKLPEIIFQEGDIVRWVGATKTGVVGEDPRLGSCDVMWEGQDHYVHTDNRNLVLVSHAAPEAQPAASEAANVATGEARANEVAVFAVASFIGDCLDNPTVNKAKALEANTALEKLVNDTLALEAERDSLRAELISAWKYVDDIAPNKAAEKEAKKQLKKLGVKSTYS